MRLLLIFLLFSSLSSAQNDSINRRWNDCKIDTFRTDGILKTITVVQYKTSIIGKTRVKHSWVRRYASNGTLTKESMGTRQYWKDGYFMIKGTSKVYNEAGRRVSTKQYQYKERDFI